MTETDVSYTQADEMITQIEAMLQNVSKKRMVEAAYVQDGLLDLLNMVNASKDRESDV
jgi:hypothetical protein